MRIQQLRQSLQPGANIPDLDYLDRKGHIGFTGTQKGMSDLQRCAMANVLAKRLGDNRWQTSWLHHGDCIGADHEADVIARTYDYKIGIHPPLNPDKRAWCVPAQGDVIHPPMDYLDRNKVIVYSTEHLIAVPAYKSQSVRSGTWSTVRFARKLCRPITLIYPDGTITEEHGR